MSKHPIAPSTTDGFTERVHATSEANKIFGIPYDLIQTTMTKLLAMPLKGSTGEDGRVTSLYSHADEYGIKHSTPGKGNMTKTKLALKCLGSHVAYWTSQHHLPMDIRTRGGLFMRLRTSDHLSTHIASPFDDNNLQRPTRRQQLGQAVVKGNDAFTQTEAEETVQCFDASTQIKPGEAACLAKYRDE